MELFSFLWNKLSSDLKKVKCLKMFKKQKSEMGRESIIFLIYVLKYFPFKM